MHLGMSRNCGARFGRVVRAGDNGVFMCDDGTNRNLPDCGSACCFAERFLHEVRDEVGGGGHRQVRTGRLSLL